MDQADVLEDAEMFGNGGLFEGESVHDITDGAFIESEERQYVAAARFGDGVEGVGGGGGAWHGSNIFPYRNMSSDIL
jgi:hypothetical protein